MVTSHPKHHILKLKVLLEQRFQVGSSNKHSENVFFYWGQIKICLSINLELFKRGVIRYNFDKLYLF